MARRPKPNTEIELTLWWGSKEKTMVNLAREVLKLRDVFNVHEDFGWHGHPETGEVKIWTEDVYSKQEIFQKLKGYYPDQKVSQTENRFTVGF